MWATTSGLLFGCWEVNSGLHTCQTLSAKPSSQPLHQHLISSTAAVQKLLSWGTPVHWTVLWVGRTWKSWLEDWKFHLHTSHQGLSYTLSTHVSDHQMGTEVQEHPATLVGWRRQPEPQNGAERNVNISQHWQPTTSPTRKFSFSSPGVGNRCDSCPVPGVPEHQSIISVSSSLSLPEDGVIRNVL